MSEVISAQQLANEAKAAYQRGDFVAAAKSYQAAAESQAAAGEALAAAEMLNNSSVAYLKAGDGQAALQAVVGTPATFAGAADIRRQGMALGNLGSALEALNRQEEALEAYRQSVDLLQRAGDDDLRMHVMQSISSVQFRTGHQLEALATMQAGLDGIKKPSMKQRVLKRLLGVPFQLLKR